MLAAVALLGFVASIAASVLILVPRSDQFVFAVSGPNVYVELFEFREDLAEVYRRLAYDLQRFWDQNAARLKPLTNAYRLGATSLVVEILALMALVSDTIV